MTITKHLFSTLWVRAGVGKLQSLGQIQMAALCPKIIFTRTKLFSNHLYFVTELSSCDRDGVSAKPKY